MLFRSSGRWPKAGEVRRVAPGPKDQKAGCEARPEVRGRSSDRGENLGAGQSILKGSESDSTREGEERRLQPTASDQQNGSACPRRGNPQCGGREPSFMGDQGATGASDRTGWVKPPVRSARLWQGFRPAERVERRSVARLGGGRLIPVGSQRKAGVGSRDWWWTATVGGCNARPRV